MPTLSNQLRLQILLANVRGALHNDIRCQYGLHSVLSELTPFTISDTEPTAAAVDILLLQETWSSDKMPLPESWSAYGEISCGFRGQGRGLKTIFSPHIKVVDSKVVSPRILASRTESLIILNCYATQRKFVWTFDK